MRLQYWLADDQRPLGGPIDSWLYNCRIKRWPLSMLEGLSEHRRALFSLELEPPI